MILFLIMHEYVCLPVWRCFWRLEASDSQDYLEAVMSYGYWELNSGPLSPAKTVRACNFLNC